tara:strand:- start:190 stop:567 length:378 start_codon:yes stop_codon:yes gene_type:complete
MKTIAQQLKVKDFPFEIKDKNNNEIYWENSNGYWLKQEFDKKNNRIYREDSSGYWAKREYDKNNNEIYFEDSDGYWVKREFDKNNNRIYYEDLTSYIVDNRPKSTPEFTMEELIDKLGYDFKIKK